MKYSIRRMMRFMEMEGTMTYKTIQIRTYYAPSGNPVCRTKEGICTFLQNRKFGTAWNCGFNNDELLENEIDKGYLQLSPECVLHNNKEIE